MILASPFTEPVRFEVKGSLSTALLVVVPLLLIAGTIALYTPGPWYLVCTLLLLLALIAAHYLRVHYWQSARQSVLEINQDAEKQWAVLAGNEWHLVDLLSSSFVSPALVVLNFKGKATSFTAILPADSLDEDTHRRLRVRVRMAFNQTASE